MRTGAPNTFILLLIYALAINFFYLSNPSAPLFSPLSDGMLYEPVVHWLQQSAGFTARGFTILTFILLFIEAIILNALANRFKVIPGESLFVAFSFLLLSCFFQKWHTFSAILIAGLPLLLLFHQLFQLFDTENGRTHAFNLGFIVGIVSLFYFPALVLVLLVWLALILARPFHLSEWLLVILGLLCPWYFLATYLFLTDQLSLLAQLPIPGFSFPSYQYSFDAMLGLPWLLAYFLYGAVQLQRAYSTLVIQYRKTWTLLLVFIIIGILLPFLPDQFYMNGWFLAFFPMSILVGFGFFSTKRYWIGHLLHFVALGFVIYIQWFR